MDFGLSEEPRVVGIRWPQLPVQGLGDVARTLEREVCVVVSSRWIVSDLSGYVVAVGVEDVCHIAVILRLVHDNSGIALVSSKDVGGLVLVQSFDG